MESDEFFERMHSIHSIILSVQTDVFTCMARGSINHNKAGEIQRKLAWVSREAKEISA